MKTHCAYGPSFASQANKSLTMLHLFVPEIDLFAMFCICKNIFPQNDIALKILAFKYMLCAAALSLSATVAM